MKRKSLYQPPDLDTPEVCHCGHYSYIHGEYGCGCWAHPDYSWRGRVTWGRIGVSLRCPCYRAWRGGQLLEAEDWERMI